LAAQSRANAEFTPRPQRARPRRAKPGAIGAAAGFLARHSGAAAQAAGGLLVAAAALALFQHSGLWRPAKDQPRVEAPAPVPPARPALVQPAPVADARPEERLAPAPPARIPAPTRSIVPARDAAVDAWFVKAYLRCWNPPAIPPGEKYSAKIRVVHNADGSLAAPPLLANPPSDPAWRPYAESALRAVTKCPLKAPAQYQAKFEQWRKMTLDFAPDSAVD
jgi:hypothetical protein